jgi:uncharacterized protein (TIGR00369 family)
MTQAQIIDTMNANKPAFLEMLGGQITGYDATDQRCTLTFEIGNHLCHSVNVVQGGFVTAMLDATMSHNALAMEGVVNVATLEIKVSFLEPSLAGRFTAISNILKAGKSTAFMTAELYNEAGQLTATATTTARLIRPR